jgi:hypothetical protein
MRKRLGDITWTEKRVVDNGHEVVELYFDRLEVGPYKGQFYPAFFSITMPFLSQFIETDFRIWRVFLGTEYFIGNEIHEDDKLVSYERAQEILSQID